MIVIQLSGGLGNQMFQYALYRKLQHMGKTVKIDDNTCYSSKENRPCQLSVFCISYERANKKEIVEITDSYMDLLSRFRRKLTGRRTKAYQETDKNFDTKIFTMTDAYLEGCWQTEKYFADITDLLRQDFSFQNLSLSTQNQEFLDQIRQCVSVGVHVRRGDYLKAEDLYGGICTEEYYQRAISRMKETVPFAEFFIFTNDVNWCKETMKGEEFHIVDCNSEETGYLDMMLMSECKHQIIANSSFSWWAAWLNRNEDKKIIAPKRWLNRYDMSDIYTEGMQLL